MTATGFLGAVAFAVSAGVATFFAPCAFPLLPGYVGYYAQRSGEGSPGLAAAGAAALGSLGALGVIAALAFALGQRLTSVLPILEPVIGVGLIVFGAAILLKRSPEMHIPLPERPESVVGFGVFGAVYALAAAGCVVPLFLGVIAQAMTLPFASGLVVIGAYAGAVAVPLVGVTLLASAGIETWRDLGRYTGVVNRVAAVLMILAGFGQLYLSIVVLDVL